MMKIGVGVFRIEPLVALVFCFFFFQAEDGIRDKLVTGVQTCALPISSILLLDLKLLSLAFQQLGGERPVGFAVVRMGDVEKRKRPEFLLAVTHDFLVDGIGGQEAALEVGQRHADGRVLKNGPPPLFAPRDLQVCLTQSFFVQLMVRDVAGNSQQLLWLAFRVANGTDHDVPPPGLLCNSRGELPNEAASAAVPGRLHGSSRPFPIRALPEINPRTVHQRGQVANFERLHATFVHRQQAALQVKHLDAILTAGDEAPLELLGSPQRLFRLFSLRDVFGERHNESRHALRARNERNVVAHPDQAAILASILLLDLKLLSFSLQQLAGERPVGFAVVRMGEVEKRKRPELLLAITYYFLVSAIHGYEAAVEVGQRHADGRILKDGPPPLLALPQRLFRLLALRNVFRNRHDGLRHASCVWNKRNCSSRRIKMPFLRRKVRSRHVIAYPPGKRPWICALFIAGMCSTPSLGCADVLPQAVVSISVRRLLVPAARREG